VNGSLTTLIRRLSEDSLSRSVIQLLLEQAFNLQASELLNLSRELFSEHTSGAIQSIAMGVGNTVVFR
jgi:hypothetical protein